jgi:hypothetical protein
MLTASSLVMVFGTTYTSVFAATVFSDGLFTLSSAAQGGIRQEGLISKNDANGTSLTGTYGTGFGGPSLMGPFVLSTVAR